ncbi:MAG: anion transporter [Methanosarcinales archaeon]|nr:anion transporter [Methanosarcinales archaeon]
MVLAAVLLLIAVRQVGGLRLQIWQIMLAGAAACLLLGEISPADAARSVNLDVMVFLFCMFVIGEALQESGYLFHLSYRLFRPARSADQLVLMILFSMGLLSAFLMNDTLAIIGTPLVLHFARAHGMSPRLLLLALAFAVTTGSAMSPIGNPQNLLIALSAQVSNPFLTFFRYLALPTAVNLLLAFLVLKLAYRNGFSSGPLNHVPREISDPGLAAISRVSLMLILVLVTFKVASVLLDAGLDFSLTAIAAVSALPVAFSRRRLEIIRSIDWQTLIFFAAMFVLMESVWLSGFFQSLMEVADLNLRSVPVILATSVVLSQFISTVPFVALYLPLIEGLGTSAPEMAALAAGSTIAGNLFILGAASNVIIIQNAEHSQETLTFWEFARVGIPLTALNVAVYWLFLAVL